MQIASTNIRETDRQAELRSKGRLLPQTLERQTGRFNLVEQGPTRRNLLENQYQNRTFEYSCSSLLLLSEVLLSQQAVSRPQPQRICVFLLQFLNSEFPPGKVASSSEEKGNSGINYFD